MLRALFLALPLALLTTASLWAQAPGREEGGGTPSTSGDRSRSRPSGYGDAGASSRGGGENQLEIQLTDKQLTVHLTEYRLTTDENASIREVTHSHDLTTLLKRLEEGDKLQQIGSTSLVGTENVPASVQSGSRVNLVSGESSGFSQPGRGPVRSYRQEHVGTLITVQWTERKEKIMLALTYEESQAEPGPEELGGPSVMTQSIHSTLGLKAGETVLVSSKRNADRSLQFLTLSVTEHE